MSEKICFIIMGFGKKTDFSTGNTFDLDKTYKSIIQPAVLQAGYQCVRADEIHDGGLIDPNMYALLIQADLVIADVSTNNPDVVYELGLRNSLRPFSTIIIKEKGIGKMPFELDHTRMFTYSHVGEDTQFDELKRSVNGLSGLIIKVDQRQLMDHPQDFMNSEIPVLPPEEYQNIVRNLVDKEKYIFAITDKARQFMEESDFDNAYKYWEKAAHSAPYETYFIQQLALAKYKSKIPSLAISLKEALVLIEQLHPTNDPETLGITGALYKNLYQNTGDIRHLNNAIEYYGKGFKTCQAYYNGENYALCLDIKAFVEKDEKEKNYYQVEASKTRKKIIELLEAVIQLKDFDKRMNKKWMFATLAHCYFLVNDDTAVYFEKKFLESAAKWEKQTYLKNKNEHIKLHMS